MSELHRRPTTYAQVTLHVVASAEEAAAAALLELGALGTACETRSGSAAGRLVVVSGYFNAKEAPSQQDVLQWIARLCPAGVPAPQMVLIESHPWRDWAGESQRSFQPIEATPDLIIAPPWDIPEVGPRQSLLVLRPGAAFGLGTHPTTRGCLLLTPVPGDGHTAGACLDIGTGSAILALRAAQLGYHPVVGYDNDPAAIESAAQNLRLNQLQDQVSLFVGEPAAIRRGRCFDLIFANIFLNPLLSLAGDIAGRLTNRGRVVVSGIRADDSAELAAAFESRGLTLEERYTAEGWSALRLYPLAGGQSRNGD